MRYYIIIGHDKDNAGHLRQKHRDAHLAYWQNYARDLAFGGPLLNDSGEMCGSMLALGCDDAALARRAAENDPYHKAGLFATLEVKAWQWVIGAPKK